MSNSMGTHAIPSVKKRLSILTMAICVALSGTFALSGCGVRSGMERIDDAKQAKKQAGDVQHKLEKGIKKGQEKGQDY
jgi:hypothetical protein